MTRPFSSVMQPVSRRAILYMTLSAVCFAAVELLGGYFVRGLSAYQLVWGRYVVHLLFMAVVFGPHYRTKLVSSKRLPLQIVRSLTMLAMPVCFILASERLPPHDIWAGYWLSPLMMLALSTWVLREPAGRTHWLTAAIGFGGMLLILRPDRALLSPASLLSLGVGLALSLHLTLSRILRHDHPLTSLFHTALWVFVSLSFVMPFLWQRPSGRDLIGVVLVGLIGMVGLLALARSGELVPLPVVAAFAYTEAIWNILLNVVLFGVLPHKSDLLGAAIIAVVTVYLFWRETHTPLSSAISAENHQSTTA